MKHYGNPKQLKTLSQYFQFDTNLSDYPFINELNELKEHIRHIENKKNVYMNNLVNSK